MGRVNRTTPLERGLMAEESFRRLLGDRLRKSDAATDRFDHIDFTLDFDIKKIRSVDEFGDSNYHWVEVLNINGNTGWLYGKANYFAFETARYWVVVEKTDLQDFILSVVENKEVLTEKKIPYRLYQRKNRRDRVVMVPVLDLCKLGFMVGK